MKVEFWPVEKPQPYDKNPRVISDQAVAKVAMSLREYGFQQPIVVDAQGIIVAGHTRLRAAKSLGLKKVPVVVADLPEEKARAYRLADNRTNQEASWDDDILAEELDVLKDLGFDLSLTGFDVDEIGELLAEATEGLTDPDETPEPPVNPVTVLGDVWVLGRHRIICGDSTKVATVETLMAGTKADMVFTDPPYGVSVVKNGMVGADFGVAKKGKYAEVVGDGTTETAQEAIALCQALKIPIQIYWGGNYYVLPPSSCWLIWDKRSDSGIENTFADCEMAWTNMTGPSRVYRQLWNGMIREGEKDKRVHPTQKPVALAEWCLEKYGSAGQTVLDLFGGSGSTLIACEKTDRNCYMVEMSPAYCDVIIERWQGFTGQKATLDGDGRTFEAIDAERYAKTGAPDNSAKSYDVAIATLREKHEEAEKAKPKKGKAA
jgi:DNA modification methylase